MPFNDLSFVALVAAAAVLFHSAKGSVWRRSVLLGASGVFLGSFGDLQSLWPVVGFAAACVLAISLAAAWRFPALPLLAGLLALFVLLKGYTPVSLAGATAVTVGLSYILFRTVQVLVDLSEEALLPEEIALPDLVLFLLSFLTLGAGPIQRYEAFRVQLATSDRIGLTDIDPAGVFGRSALGYVKLILLAPPLIEIHARLVASGLAATPRLGLAAALFMLWIYVNFSGYMDIVIGLGRIFGFALPENFNRPDRAANFIDLWSRWHITLSRTFLTYVFNPMVRWLLVHAIAPGPVSAGIAAYLTVFFLLGYWHGSGSNFALTGLFFGIAAMGNKLWQEACRRWPWLAFDIPFGSVLGGGLGLGACATAIVPTWPLFTSAQEALVAFGSPGRFFRVFLLASSVGCLVRLVGSAVDTLGSKPRLRSTLARCATSPALVGIVAALVVGVALIQSADLPAIVYYQRF